MMKKVISASRRTDLVAFFPEWFATVLKQKEAKVHGPSGHTYTVNLSPDVIHSFVLWSKNFENVIENRAGLKDLLQKYDQIYCHFTITGLGDTFIERGVPPYQTSLGTEKRKGERPTMVFFIWILRKRKNWRMPVFLFGWLESGGSICILAVRTFFQKFPESCPPPVSMVLFSKNSILTERMSPSLKIGRNGLNAAAQNQSISGVMPSFVPTVVFTVMPTPKSSLNYPGSHIFFGDVISCPVNGRGSNRVESLHRVKATDGLVVVASYRGNGLKEADSLDDLVRRCPVTNQISKEEVMIDFSFLCEFEEGQEGFHIPVNICENEISHS